MWFLRNVSKLLRRSLIRHQYLITTICFLLCVETLLHINSYEVKRPAVALDEPFIVGCQEPDVHAPRENAAIVMLARNRELNGAVKSVKSIERQFNRWFHYPIVFLNDEPWDQAFIDALTKVSSGIASFEVIEAGMWGFPDWMDQNEARSRMKQQEKMGVMYAGLESYHHMCRFNSGKFYDHKALKPYKWYWRLEPDVEFTCAIPYDPFVAMAKNGKKYGYTMALWELGTTVPTMFRKVSDYKRRHGIPSTSLWNAMIDPSWAPLPLRPLMSWLGSRDASGDAWNLCHYWSNFEIADMDWFRTKEYREFFEFLDADGGFYFERWGDAPIHSLAAALFLSPEQLHHFEDIGYVHEPFQSCPTNAKGRQLPGSETFGPGHWDGEEKGGVGCRCTCDPRGGGPDGFCLNRLKQAVR